MVNQASSKLDHESLVALTQNLRDRSNLLNTDLTIDRKPDKALFIFLSVITVGIYAAYYSYTHILHT